MKSSNNLRQGAREIMVRVFKIPLCSFPVPCGAMTIIGVSTLPPIMGDELFITMGKAAILNSYQPRKK